MTAFLSVDDTPHVHYRTFTSLKTYQYMWIRWRDGNTLDSGLIKVFYNIHGTECSKFALECERQPSANEWKSPRFPSQIIAPHFVTRSRYSLDNFQTINNWRKRREKKKMVKFVNTWKLERKRERTCMLLRESSDPRARITATSRALYLPHTAPSASII